MQGTMMDCSYPDRPGPDTLGITIYRKNGGVGFSSNWDATQNKTTEKPIASAMFL